MTRVDTIKEKYGEDFFAKSGKKGGKAKVKKGTASLSPAKRKERAKEAANKRWDQVRFRKEVQEATKHS